MVAAGAIPSRRGDGRGDRIDRIGLACAVWGKAVGSIAAQAIAQP